MSHPTLNQMKWDGALQSRYAEAVAQAPWTRLRSAEDCDEAFGRGVSNLAEKLARFNPAALPSLPTIVEQALVLTRSLFFHQVKKCAEIFQGVNCRDFAVI